MEQSEIIIESIDQLELLIKENAGALIYFSTPDCSVCKVLKPKVKEMLANDFPLVKFAYVDVSKAKETAAQHSIFTVPTIIIYFEGKEFQRRSRNFGVDEVRQEISRPYTFLFEAKN